MEMTKEVTMKRMITAALTTAALAIAPGAQALGVTPKKAARIAKQVLDREITAWEASRARRSNFQTTSVSPFRTNARAGRSLCARELGLRSLTESIDTTRRGQAGLPCLRG
jgi:hypothetical protein